MTEAALTVTIASGPALEALSAAAESAPKVFDSLSRLADLPAERLLTLDCDAPATAGTGEALVRLNPSEGLLRLVAALRAFEAELGACEQLLRHDVLSIVSSSDPMVGQGPAAVASGSRPRGGS